MDDEVIDLEFLSAQHEALERSRRDKDQMLEEQALAKALQLSREEEERRLALEASEALARRLQQEEEITSTDYTLASALESSEKQAHQYEVMRTSQVLAESTAISASQNRERNVGRWDCQICTFNNRPYSPKCAACDSEAPEHVLTFSKIPNVRFGLEIEMVIPGGKRDGFTLESIANDLHQLGPPFVKYCGYSHETTPYWKIVTDASIAGDRRQDDLTFELVSPVLRGEEGLRSLRTIMDHVRRLGISTNASCGFHVHVDAEKGNGNPVANFDALKRIARCFCSVENAFDLIVSNSSNANGRRNANANHFCCSNRLVFGERSCRQRWEILSVAHSVAHLVQLMNPNYDRYHKLNLTNLTKDSRPSTIEFRHHGGVEDLPQAEAWVRLVVGLCYEAAIRTDEKVAELCLLSEGASPRTELRALFDLVNCTGLEQFFVLDRRLFDGCRLQNKWECRVCHRVFENSRSLSQHCRGVGH